MTAYHIAALLMTLAAFMSFVNERFLNLPGKIAHFLLATLLALGIIACENIAPGLLHGTLRDIIMDMQFGDVLLGSALSFLLYAGAFRIPLGCLHEEKKLVAGLAFLTTAMNTAFMGGLIWAAFQLMPYDLLFIWALVFGAIVSPTDPLSAVSILTKIGLPKRLEAILVGESLFNDGIAFVLFTILSAIAAGTIKDPVFGGMALFGQEVLGGAGMGLIFAGLVHYMVKSTDDVCFHLLVSVTVVITGYVLCSALHVSGPIAMAVAGLIGGNITFKAEGPEKESASRTESSEADPDISRQEQHDINIFWVMVDDIINAVLFVMIGLQLVRVPFGWEPLLTGIAAIIALLVSRYISVFTTLGVIQMERSIKKLVGMANLLTWAGLRGGLSVAMALTLPEGEIRTLLVNMTFAIVAFSLLAQGLSIKIFFSESLLQKISYRQAQESGS